MHKNDLTYTFVNKIIKILNHYDELSKYYIIIYLKYSNP
jgi:hypothetical protein